MAENHAREGFYGTKAGGFVREIIVTSERGFSRFRAETQGGGEVGAAHLSEPPGRGVSLRFELRGMRAVVCGGDGESVATHCFRFGYEYQHGFIMKQALRL